MRTVLVTGGHGRAGSALVPLLRERGWVVRAPGHAELEITAEDAVRAAVGPDVEAVVNLAAWADLARCERDEAAAVAVNGTAVGHLARACDAVGAHLVHVSTDYVFDGEKGAPYVEDDPVGPLSAYARSKRAGEVEAGPHAAVVRTAWVSGTTGTGLVTSVLDQAAAPDRRLAYVADQWSTPTTTPDLARALADLLEVRATGTFHVANAGTASRHEVAAHVLAVAGLDPARVEAVPAASRPDDGVHRPRATPLADTRLAAVGVAPLRPWQEAYAELVEAVTTAKLRP